jgi:hypothetical protein
MRFRVSVLPAMLSAAIWLATPAWAAPFFFTTGNADGKVGSLSRRPSPGKIETETADDFALNQTTVISHATITGLINVPVENINNVEVEVYHVFPVDSVNPPSGHVPSRMNSPSDFEIASATRDASLGTLRFTTNSLNANFSVQNTVLDDLLKSAGTSGEEVQITVTFNPPIVLPAGNYFFRPEVDLTGGNFLYLSAPRPIVAPGIPFAGDRQAWIRNSNLAPDWLRIGTDIFGGATPPTFNMTFSLTGDTVPEAGTPGQANCHGKTDSALAHQFGGIDGAASSLGFSSVQSLQDTFTTFCEP